MSNRSIRGLVWSDNFLTSKFEKSPFSFVFKIVRGTQDILRFRVTKNYHTYGVSCTNCTSPSPDRPPDPLIVLIPPNRFGKSPHRVELNLSRRTFRPDRPLIRDQSSGLVLLFCTTVVAVQRNIM